jgi:hypothetical protein
LGGSSQASQPLAAISPIIQGGDLNDSKPRTVDQILEPPQANPEIGG